jgi:hypothetical protein
MTEPNSPRYDVLDKWDSVSFDDTTRAVLQRRLQQVPPPRFFDAEAFRTLEAACARLLATPPGQPPVANWIDADLHHGAGEGFRHHGIPPLQQAWRQGMAGLQAHARTRHGSAFAELSPDTQDAVLRELQQGETDASLFGDTPPQHFLTHMLLKAAAAHFYSTPQAWSEIGFGGPASPRGYVRLGLDQWDPWEAPPPTAQTTQER